MRLLPAAAAGLCCCGDLLAGGKCSYCGGWWPERCCVFQSWAGGSCGCYCCRGGWWLGLRLGPPRLLLRLLLQLAASAAYDWRRVRPLLRLVVDALLMGVGAVAAPAVAASGVCDSGSAVWRLLLPVLRSLRMRWIWASFAVVVGY